MNETSMQNVYRNLLSLYTSGRSVNKYLEHYLTQLTTNSLAVDDINDSAELSEIRSIVDIGNTSDLNKTSEHLKIE